MILPKKYRNKETLFTALAILILMIGFYSLTNFNITGFSVYNSGDIVNESVEFNFDDIIILPLDSVVSVNLGESYDAKTIEELYGSSLNASNLVVDTMEFGISAPYEEGDYELSVSLIVNATVVDRVKKSISVIVDESVDIDETKEDDSTVVNDTEVNDTDGTGSNDTFEINYTMEVNDTIEPNISINETIDYNITTDENISSVINDTGLNESIEANDTVKVNGSVELNKSLDNLTINDTIELNETITGEIPDINESIGLNQTDGVELNETIDINITTDENISSVINDTIDVNVTINKTTDDNVTEYLNITEDINETINITSVNETINVSEINITALNKTINITTVNETKNLTVSNATIKTNRTIKQYKIKIGKPVKWKKRVKLTSKSANITVDIPKEAKNISVIKIENGIEEIVENVTVKIEGEEEKLEEFNSITGFVVREGEGKGWVARFFNWLIRWFRGITGFVVVDDIEENESIVIIEDKIVVNESKVVVEDELSENVNSLVIEDEVEEVEIEYYTEGPKAEETVFSSSKKRVVISSDIHYTDILAFSELPAEASLDSVKLYWIVNDSRKEVYYDGYDTNENGLVDYIEWIVPNLSNQTYEIEISILNVQSYPMLEGNWTVIFNTSGTANLSISAVNSTTGYNASDDLEFLELRCGEDVLSPNISKDAVFVQDYVCNETGYHTVKVHSTGKHTQMFKFGNQTDYAYNDVATQGVPVLNSTFGTNLTTENLTVYNTSTSDPEGDLVKNIIDWKKDGQSITVLNIPFENNTANVSNSTKDYSGYSNNCYVSGAMFNSSGGYDGKGVYDFDGVDDHLSINDSSSLDLTESMTIEAWIYPRSFGEGGYGRIVDKNYPGYVMSLVNSGGCGNGTEGNNNCLGMTAGGITTGCSDTNSISLNEWQHIAVTYDRSSWRFYVNGAAKGVINDTAPISINSDDILIGESSGMNRAFDGKIDELKIYNYSLSAEQIKVLYENRTDLIVSDETSKGDVWQACITPNDGTGDGYTNCSNNLTILDPVNINISLYPEDINTSDNVVVFGKIRLSNGTDASNTTFGVYVNGTLANIINVTKGSWNTSDWWNRNWRFRREINLTEETGNNLIDYQINFSIDTKSLIFDNKMQPYCDDIRVIDKSNSSINHWVEQTCNTNSTTIWIRTNISSSSNKTIYLYYGNNLAESESNGTNVFDQITQSEFNSSWKYSGLTNGTDCGWDSRLVEFDYDDTGWSSVDISTDYTVDSDNTTWYVRKELFISEGVVGITGEFDDDYVFSLIGSDSHYKRIGGDQNKCSAFGKQWASYPEFNESFTQTKEFGRYMLAGRGHNGQSSAYLRIINITSGIENIYTRNTTYSQPTKTLGREENYLLPETDADGNYNVSFIAPLIPGNYKISVNVNSDGTIGEEYKNLTINNRPINISGLIGNQTWEEDNINYLDISRYFLDVEGSELRYESTPVDNISISIHNKSGIVTMIPDTEWYGERYVVFTAFDNYGENATSNNITLIVTGINDTPYLTSDIQNIRWRKNKNETLNISSYFAHPEGSDLNYTSTQPDNITVLIDNSTGIITFIPDTNFTGTNWVVLTAWDIYNNSATSNNITLDVISRGELLCEWDSNSLSGCSNGGTRVIGMEADDNSHAELPGQTNYPGGICCKDIGGNNLELNTSFGNNWLDISSETNAHVEMPTEGNYGYNLRFGNSLGVVRCGLSDNCSGYQTCLLEISTSSSPYTNAQVGSCDSGYTKKVCCNLNYSDIVVYENVHPGISLLNSNVSVYGNVSLGTGEKIADKNISIYLNEVRLYYNETLGLLVNYTTPNITRTDSNGEYSYIFKSPAYAANNTVKVNVTHEGLSGESSVIFTTNTPPSASSIPNMSWPEDSSNSLNLSSYFSDADGDDLNWISTYVMNITVDIDNETGVVNLTPDANFTGIRYAVFTATDTLNITESNNITLNITPVNDAPHLANVILNMTWDEDVSNTSLNLSYNFYDIEGDNLTFKCNGTTNLNISIDNNTGIVNITPHSNWNGVNYMVCYAYDISGLSASSNNITLTIRSIVECGDGVCSGGETCEGCQADCGSCPGEGGEGAGGGEEACSDNEKECWDGFIASCGNYRIDGSCTNCEPDCTGHEDPCTGVVCEEDYCEGKTRHYTEGCVLGECEYLTEECEYNCEDSVCASESCGSGEKDGDETDVDCGGSCFGCEIDEGCLDGADCLSEYCDTLTFTCQIEPECTFDFDCEEGYECMDGMCELKAETCDDGILNQGEEGIDCGGPCAPCVECVDDDDCGDDYECKDSSCVLEEIEEEIEEERKPTIIERASGEAGGRGGKIYQSFGEACVNVTKNIVRKKLTKAAEDFEFEVPEGYEVIVPPFNVDCITSDFKLTLSIPKNYEGVKSLRCIGEQCVGKEVGSVTELQCGGKLSRVIKRETEYIKPEAYAIDLKKKEATIDLAERSVSSGGNIIEFSGKIDEGFSVVLDKSEKELPEPKNINLKIVGTPIEISVKKTDSTNPMSITMPYEESDIIDEDSLSIYVLNNGDWEFVGGDGSKEENILSVELTDINPYIADDGKARFAIIGSYCVNCLSTKLQKVYEPHEGSKDAIVLVHGFASNPATFDLIIKDIVLTKQPWQAWTFGYPSKRKIKENAVDLADLLQANNEEFDFLYIAAHSMGGLVTQEALQYAYEENNKVPGKYSFINKVRKVVLVGVPNQGSPATQTFIELNNYLTNINTKFGVFDVYSEGFKDLIKGINVSRIPGVEYYSIVGTKGYDFSVGNRKFSTEEIFKGEENDGMVSTDSATLIGGEYADDECKDYWEIDETHTGLLDNPSSRELIEKIIAREILVNVKDKAVIGNIRYFDLEISDCDPSAKYVVIGKKIPQEKVFDPTGCGCGNGYCGKGENKTSCPEDCARLLRPENVCTSSPFILLFVLFIAFITGMPYVYKRYLSHQRINKVFRSKIITISSIVSVTASGIYTSVYYLFDNMCASQCVLPFARYIYIALVFLSAYLIYHDFYVYNIKKAPGDRSISNRILKFFSEFTKIITIIAAVLIIGGILYSLVLLYFLDLCLFNSAINVFVYAISTFYFVNIFGFIVFDITIKRILKFIRHKWVIYRNRVQKEREKRYMLNEFEKATETRIKEIEERRELLWEAKEERRLYALRKRKAETFRDRIEEVHLKVIEFVHKVLHFLGLYKHPSEYKRLEKIYEQRTLEVDKTRREEEKLLEAEHEDMIRRRKLLRKEKIKSRAARRKRVEGFIWKTLHVFGIYKTEEELEEIKEKKELEDYKIEKQKELIEKAKEEDLLRRLKEREEKLKEKAEYDREKALSKAIDDLNKKIAELHVIPREELERKPIEIKHEKFRVEGKESEILEKEKERIDERLRWKPKRAVHIKRKKIIPKIKKFLTGERKLSDKEKLLDRQINSLKGEIKELERKPEKIRFRRKRFDIPHKRFKVEGRGSETLDKEKERIDERLRWKPKRAVHIKRKPVVFKIRKFVLPTKKTKRDEIYDREKQKIEERLKWRPEGRIQIKRKSIPYRIKEFVLPKKKTKKDYVYDKEQRLLDERLKWMPEGKVSIKRKVVSPKVKRFVLSERKTKESEIYDRQKKLLEEKLKWKPKEMIPVRRKQVVSKAGKFILQRKKTKKEEIYEREKQKIYERLKWRPEKRTYIKRERIAEKTPERRSVKKENIIKKSNKEKLLDKEIGRLDDRLKNLRKGKESTNFRRKKFEIKHKRFRIKGKESDVLMQEKGKIDKEIKEMEDMGKRKHFNERFEYLRKKVKERKQVEFKKEYRKREKTEKEIILDGEVQRIEQKLKKLSVRKKE